jgi:hypothetical protein
MTLTKQIAKHLRDLHYGGNWTCSNLKDILSGITWQQATKKVHNFNTIATLVYHVGYFVSAQIDVLEGRPMTAKDELSFNHPPIQSQADWEKLVNATFKDAEKAADLIEQLPDSILSEIFVDAKYGNYFRNLHGMIEHTHYHMGQIALIKKLVAEHGNQ